MTTLIKPSTHTGPRHAQPATDQKPPAFARATAIVVGLTVAVSLLFIAFALPAAKSKPHEVPVGIAAPAAVAGQFENGLNQNAPGGFALTSFADQDALRSAIRDREVYGGIAVTQDGPTVLVATGGSPMVAQMLTQLGSGMAQQSGMPLRTEDLAPLPAADARGVGLAAAALPLTLAGLLPVMVLLSMFPNAPWLRLGTTVVFTATASLAVTGLLFGLFGSVQDNFIGVTAGLTLGALATALPVLGLGSLFGRTGMAIGAAVAMLLGNPLSGLNSAPELLPSGWGTLGQLLPQGANATLLRSTAYFSGAGAGAAIAVLTCWTAAGLALVVIAGLRGRHTATAPYTLASGPRRH